MLCRDNQMWGHNRKDFLLSAGLYVNNSFDFTIRHQQVEFGCEHATYQCE